LGDGLVDVATGDVLTPFEPAAALDSEMTVEQLAAERAKVVDAILALGVLGSPEEQPVCTLSRYLQQPARQLPERAVFLVISDEDDTSSTEQACVGSYEYRQSSSVRGSLVEGCTQNCDSYRFSVARRVAQNSFAFDCAPVDDLGNVGSPDTWRAGSFQRTLDTCDSTSAQPCSDEEQQRAQAKCDAGYFVQNCTRTCANDATDEICRYSSTDGSHDLCNESFGSGDYVYANLVDYCERAYQATDWGPCTRVGFSVENVGSALSQTSVTSPVVRAKSVDDMIYLFHADAARSFGEQNYFVESILFTEGSSCVPQAGQSYGTELAKLASSPEQVYPICESYAPAPQQRQQLRPRSARDRVHAGARRARKHRAGGGGEPRRQYPRSRTRRLPVRQGAGPAQHRSRRPALVRPQTQRRSARSLRTPHQVTAPRRYPQVASGSFSVQSLQALTRE
jgi:hypothetical protein